MGHIKIENGLGTTIGDAVEFLLETGYRDALQLSDRC
jgi:hypothetical protein